MALDDAENHGEAEAGSQIALGGKEWLQASPAHFLGHAAPGVADGEGDALLLELGRERDLVALRHGVDRVEDEVGERFAELRRVAQDARDLAWLDPDGDLAAGRGGLAAPARLGESDRLLDELI